MICKLFTLHYFKKFLLLLDKIGKTIYFNKKRYTSDYN